MNKFIVVTDLGSDKKSKLHLAIDAILSVRAPAGPDGWAWVRTKELNNYVSFSSTHGFPISAEDYERLSAVLECAK